MENEKHRHPCHKQEIPRLNRVIGQLEGVKKMIEELRYCPDILIQLRAARSAIRAVESNILKTHLQSCVAQSFASEEIIFAVRSCGVSHKTPERVVKTLIESYESGNENKIKKCYGVTKADDNLQAEIDANIKYFAAHSPEKIQINSCDKIYQDGNYAFMYITYDLVLKDGQSYPCISTYMTQKKDDNKYYILAPSDVTNDMNKQAAEKYALFMKTDAYQQYTVAYDKFIKKNPGYEEKIASKLS